MNIAFYLKHFPANGLPIMGGSAKALHGMAYGLVENGAKVTILCEGKTRSSVVADTGYRIECFQNTRKFRTFEISHELKNFIKENFSDKESMITIHGIFNPSGYSISRFLRANSIPYILAPQDPYHPTIFKKNLHLKWPYWYLFERRVLKQASSVQVFDQRHAIWLEKLGIKTPVIAAPPGFSPDEVRDESVLRWREATLPSILYLGRIDLYNKGLDILIDAFAELLKIYDAKLTIQGPDGGDLDKLKSQVSRLNLSNRVFFKGPDYSKTSSEIISQHDIFCSPSRFEGFGLSALEAILAARVLLVSEIAGIAPYISESGCGVVVRPTVTEVTNGLLELLRRRSQWKEIGLKGRQYALDNLKWQKITSSVLTQYQKLVA